MHRRGACEHLCGFFPTCFSRCPAEHCWVCSIGGVPAVRDRSGGCRRKAPATMFCAGLHCMPPRGRGVHRPDASERCVSWQLAAVFFSLWASVLLIPARSAGVYQEDV
eukprot:TRINITY_DN295_c0_g1_i4.p4 TRINITY_DN295_c0_g1~~TRINITY_DN295_c0_g1_i4.p4  ORF type:complete len:108 (+),score=3.58 TRINITY_DN295_c0_g1_i4:376-699(+)